MISLTKLQIELNLAKYNNSPSDHIIEVQINFIKGPKYRFIWIFSKFEVFDGHNIVQSDINSQNT